MHEGNDNEGYIARLMLSTMHLYGVGQSDIGSDPGSMHKGNQKPFEFWGDFFFTEKTDY